MVSQSRATLAMTLAVVTAAVVTVAGCGEDSSSSSSSSGTTSGTGGTGGAVVGGGGQGGSTSSSGTGGNGAAPPFTCEPDLPGSPQLAAQMHFDPAEPHPGDTLTVIVRSTNGTSPGDSPGLVLEAEGAAGMTTEQITMRAGGGDTLYYFAVPNVELGDLCLLALVDGTTPEIAGKVTVTERPAGPPVENGIYKVITHHQWTCSEQPTYGNEIHVSVQDENGQGVAGAVVDVNYADSTDPGSIYNDEGNIPDTVQMDGSGHYVGYNYWPISDHGFMVFKLSVQGEPSDIATELTTGWWEANDENCNYCGEYGKNVWGHWSHTVVFQRDVNATEICEVDTDHAGQQSCAIPGHLHHHPQHQACWTAP